MESNPADILVQSLIEENDQLNQELQDLKLNFSELESTNNHLVSATWRERIMKKKLVETIGELNATKLIVDTQNKRISESINYSQQIQRAINPNENELQEIFPNSFIYYLPKDVISGDFPWLYKFENYVYLASVDCTGHGVPGAMMSMIGNLLLKDIMNKGLALLPSEILTRLHFAVVNTLRQNSSGSQSNDGMDIALVRFNLDTKELVFSGAHRPLFIQKGEKIESVSGDRFPIGGMQYKGKNTYTDTFFTLEKSNRVILFTDGLPDQIGGDNRKKLMTNGVKEFFDSRVLLPFETLKSDLVHEFTTWKNKEKQVDDVLLLAFEL